jgi:hypothetical protein
MKISCLAIEVNELQGERENRRNLSDSETVQEEKFGAEE